MSIFKTLRITIVLKVALRFHHKETHHSIVVGFHYALVYVD